MLFYIAAGKKDSNKHLRCLEKPEGNEDYYDIHRFNQTEELVDGILFLSIYDGHGGANASRFARKYLRNLFENTVTADPNGDVLDMLKRNFAVLDREFYRRVQRGKKRCAKEKKDCCTCKFAMEDPCPCMDPKILACEGSTATVLVLKEKDLYIANVGDSEAVMYSFHDCFEHKESSGLKFKLLTQNHCPQVNEKNADYCRLKEVLEQRKNTYGDDHIFCKAGIRKGPVERFNFVRLAGAHSLNMTRALGNFGHKTFTTKEGGEVSFVEEHSTVINRPFLSHKKLEGAEANSFIVIASDGLWDNLSMQQVGSVVFEVIKSSAPPTWELLTTSEKYASRGVESNQEFLLAYLSMRAASALVEQAMIVGRKPDDISVVVVLFSSILSLII